MGSLKNQGAAALLVYAGTLVCAGSSASGQGVVRWEGLAVHDQPIAALGTDARLDLSPSLNGSLNLPQVGRDGTVVYQAPFQLAGGSEIPQLATLYRVPGAGPVVVMRDDSMLDVAGVGMVNWLGAGRPIGAGVDPASLYVVIEGNGISTANNELLARVRGVGQVTPLIREGQMAPGAGAGVVFGPLGVPFQREPFYANERGDIAAWLTLAGAGVTTANDASVWLIREGAAPELVLREGPAGPTSTDVIDQLDAPAVNDRGDVAVRGRVRLANQSTQANIWMKRAGEATQLRFASGSLVAGGAPGERYFLLSYGVGISGSMPGQVLQMNNQGRIVAWGEVRPPVGLGVRALMSNMVGDDMSVIMREGQTVAPGWNLSLGVTGSPVLSDSGHMVISAFVRPPQGGSVAAIVAHHPVAGLRLVARQGQTAEGLAPGQTIDGDFRGIALNESGDVVFTSRLAGSGVGAFNRAWWVSTVDGRLELLAKGGDTARVVLQQGGQIENEVSGMDLFESYSTNAGSREVLSDRGEVAGALHFANDTTAVVLGRIELCRADMGSEGAAVGRDGNFDNNDLVVFVQSFFEQHPRADLGSEGGEAVADGLFDNNDFVVFIQGFFGGCE